MIRPATLSTSAATGMPKHVAKAFQNSARHAPKPFKFEARGALVGGASLDGEKFGRILNFN